MPFLKAHLRTFRALLLATAIASANAAETAPLVALQAQARQDAAATEPSALPELEATLEFSNPLSAEFEGLYWQAIRASDDYPRAYRFFAALASTRGEEAEVDACDGCAIGGYCGWLFKRGLGAYAFPALDRAAEAAFARALTLDPANFTALLGRTVYDAHVPGRQESARADFVRLDALRGAHPELPWAAVDEAKRSLGTDR